MSSENVIPYPQTPNEPSHHAPPGSPQPEVGPREQPIHAPIPIEQPHPAVPQQPPSPEVEPGNRVV